MAAEWTMRDAAAHVRMPQQDDDKYRRGVRGLVTGSEDYPGAAVLGVEAAYRTGIGMVRYVGPALASELVLHRRPEVVLGDGRVQAWVIGSGTDAASRTDAAAAALRGILSGVTPVVVDAGALDLAPRASAPVVVTPHAGEHRRLREALGVRGGGIDGDSDAGREASALQTARVLGATVLLKGAVTIVATADGWCRRVAAGTPWLATAGTGDVLAGAIGALVAGAAARGDREALGPLAATGALLHGRAARIAAGVLGPRGGPITALDVAAALPHAVGELLTGDRAGPS